jgi:hypothetical protein
MQDQAPVRVLRSLVQVIDPRSIEERRAALDAVDFVALGEQQLGEVGAVLAGDAGDECDFGADDGPLDDQNLVGAILPAAPA